jgi:hypothetical protein
MSKYMQMKVTIVPYYQAGFKKAYPKLTHALSLVDKAITEKEPALFELVGRLDKLLYQLDGNEPVRKIILQHRQKLFDLYEDIEGDIADWQLAKADQALYKMEDAFDEIERELGDIWEAWGARP